MSMDKVQTSDWKRVDAMKDDESEANALADPDNQPMTQEQLRSAPRMPQVNVIRRALRLTQEEFGPLPDTTRHIARLGTEPDQPARAYLKVIAVDPAGTAAALKKSAV